MSAPGISISFAPQIDAFARAHDLDLDPESADSLNATLQSLMQVDVDNNVAFAIGGDRTGTLEDALAVYSEGMPRKGNSPGSPIAVAAGSNRTARAVATNAARRTPVSQAKAAEAVSLVSRFGNPWKTGNLTHRAFVTNTNPVLANKLKSEAGVRP